MTQQLDLLTLLTPVKAEAVAPEEAVYPSNLSASLYELGNYASCFEAICRAARNLSESEAKSTLLLRLSARLAKTLSFGVYTGAISSESVRDATDVIGRLSAAADEGDASEELTVAWKDWKRVQKQLGCVENRAPDARFRLSKLPIFKQPMCVSMLLIDL